MKKRRGEGGREVLCEEGDGGRGGTDSRILNRW